MCGGGRHAVDREVQIAVPIADGHREAAKVGAYDAYARILGAHNVQLIALALVRRLVPRTVRAHPWKGI